LAQKLAALRDGLVIVTGVTGSGKTTTLAMIVNLLNRAGGCRIITVEDPVEYLFPKVDGSVLTQREVGGDLLTFADGLKYGFRQDHPRDCRAECPRSLALESVVTTNYPARPSTATELVSHRLNTVETHGKKGPKKRSEPQMDTDAHR